MTDDLIERILSNAATGAEKYAFYEKLRQHPDLQRDFLNYRKFRDLEQIVLQEEQLHDHRASFRHFWRQTGHRDFAVSQKWGSIIVTAFAAMVVLFWGISYLISDERTPVMMHFHAAEGSVVSVYLNDSSLIMLNSGTDIRICQTATKVEVKLQGEAFFKIRHNPQRQFFVDAGSLKIEDVGTTFNVAAYRGAPECRTTLLDGQIFLKGRDGKQLAHMSQPRTLTYNRITDQLRMEKINPLIVTGWTQNKFVFIDQSLEEICGEIARWYDVSVDIADKSLAKQRFSCVILRTTTVRQFMDMLRLAANIHYSMNEDEQTNHIEIKIQK